MSLEASKPIHLEVTPARGMADELVEICVFGLDPLQEITIKAQTKDVLERQWSSKAVFIADAEGRVALSTQAPVHGSYTGIDPFGLFWSMALLPKQARPPKQKPLSSLFGLQVPITITVEIAGLQVASIIHERLLISDSVVGNEIHENGLVASFYYPDDKESHPAVILLNGSDGTRRSEAAAFLASHGFAALALAYFGSEGLPQNLASIPLEYFEQALSWLQGQPAVSQQRISVLGLSRGGELALLLGATFPQIGAVVAGAPSGLLQTGFVAGAKYGPAWTLHGEALPYSKPHWNVRLVFTLYWQAFKRQGFAGRAMFLSTLDDKEVEKSTIAVEQIQGPVLLISGGDDQLWPSDVFAEQIMKRLKEHEHAYRDQHFCYPEAGHFVCVPYGFPSLPPMVQPAPGMIFGGSVRANAASVADSWPKILAFLRAQPVETVSTGETGQTIMKEHGGGKNEG